MKFELYLTILQEAFADQKARCKNSMLHLCVLFEDFAAQKLSDIKREVSHG